jgi:hypothetical protein
MSKERELLIKARDVLRGLKGTHYDLYWDIQTALDQPEQEPINFDLKPELSDEQKRLEVIAIKQREAHGIGDK